MTSETTDITHPILGARGFLVALFTWASVHGAGDNDARIRMQDAARLAGQRFHDALAGSPIEPGDPANPWRGDELDILTTAAMAKVLERGGMPSGAADLATNLATLVLMPAELRHTALRAFLWAFRGAEHLQPPPYAIGRVEGPPSVPTSPFPALPAQADARPAPPIEPVPNIESSPYASAVVSHKLKTLILGAAALSSSGRDNAAAMARSQLVPAGLEMARSCHVAIDTYDRLVSTIGFWQEAALLPMTDEVAIIMPPQGAGSGGGQALFLWAGLSWRRADITVPTPTMTVRVLRDGKYVRLHNFDERDSIPGQPEGLYRCSVKPLLIQRDDKVEVRGDELVRLPTHQWNFRLLGAIVPYREWTEVEASLAALDGKTGDP